MNEKNRWYQVRFVWLVVLLPFTAVVGSFVSLALAIHSDDGLVEDDYYKRGMEINRALDRDRAAVTHGLESTLDLDATRHELLIKLTARQAMAWPESVKLQLMYATRAGLDRNLVMARGVDGTYRAPLPELVPGHWNAQLTAQDWRLTGSIFIPGDNRLVMRPTLP